MLFDSKICGFHRNGKNQNTKRSVDSIITSLEFSLKLLRLLGVFPFGFKRLESGEVQLHFRLLSLPTLWVAFINTVFMTGDSWSRYTLTVITSNGYDIVKTLKALCMGFHTTTLYLYFCYFMFRCRHLQALFYEWEELIPQLKFTKPDKNLKCFGIIISITFLCIAMIENSIFFYTLVTTNMGEVGPYEPIIYKEDDHGNLFLKILSIYSQDNLSDIQNQILSTGKVIRQAFRAWAWTLADVFLVLLFRAISFRFQALAENAFDIADKKAPELWEDIRCDYEQLHRLLKKLNAFLSPPLLFSYLINIVLTGVHLYQWISSKGINGGHGTTTYASISSLLLTLRMTMITLYGSKIHENAHSILAAVEKCSSSTYSISLERLERKLASQKIGLTVGGVFFISRTLFASLTSIIFTLEIFLLQAAGQPLQSQGG